MRELYFIPSMPVRTPDATTRSALLVCMLLLVFFPGLDGEQGKGMSLNKMWDFDQTAQAFPPENFTRKCPVPGLAHLAGLRIEAHE